jgi:cation:H+ antiporter
LRLVWIVDALACAAGLVLLAVAADHLVLGASALAARFGVPMLVVGVVVIGVGTSSPELLVSSLAALRGSADVGVGNVVGSNIANLMFVLGIAALVTPVRVTSRLLRREVPLTVAASVAFALALLGGLSRVEGTVLLLLMVTAFVLLIRWSRPSLGETEPLAADVAEAVDTELAATGGSTRREVVRAGLGLLGTLVGAQLLVSGALGVAEAAGLSGGAVGLTIVAGGTSLPELVTAVQAARRGESQLVVGNVLGSNIINALGVGGVVALLAPGPVNGSGLAVGAVAMCVVSVLALALMRRRFVVTRPEAVLLVVGYVALVPVLAAG